METTVDGEVLRSWLETAIASVKAEVKRLEDRDEVLIKELAAERFANQKIRMIFGMQRNYDEVEAAVRKNFVHGAGGTLYHLKYDTLVWFERMLKEIPPGKYGMRIKARTLYEIRKHAGDADA